MTNPVILLGAGGHGGVVLDALLLCGANVVGVCDPALDAGATTPQALSIEKIQQVITEAGRDPIERDTVYRRVLRDAENFNNWTVGEEVSIGS